MCNDNVLNAVSSVVGFLDPEESRMLYDLASRCPPNGIIVELGNYQGKSTVSLGLGAKEAGAFVWTIDDHAEHSIDALAHYGIKDNAALMENLTLFGLGETVRIISLKSYEVAQSWTRKIDLLFIDADHSYEGVKRDFECWSPHVRGFLAFHDSSGHFPEVSRLMEEIIAAGEWERVKLVDATSVFKRKEV